MKEVMEKGLNSELWHACAGGMVQMPPVNSKVFYFPQGHAEHSLAFVDFLTLPRIPPLILCRVASVKYLADPKTDEVYAKISLVPIGNNDVGFDDDGVLGSNNEKPNSFSKTLTQSDANNGGGFSVPRYCAETIFPPLDYAADPPVQSVIAKDVHGETWKFRHIYRGTPRRHLLTTGWSSFVNQKKLVAGDSVVFLRAENGDICIGFRRAKRGCDIGGSWNESSLLWNSYSAGNYGEKKVMHKSFGIGTLREKGRVRPESVVESAFLAANGHPFEVVYYPRACTPEFFVKASSVEVAMRCHWSCGMRFKMAFETEDSSRISWFMGTITSVQAVDPITWPKSLWRRLQVAWDEPELLQNVKCVSPWLVEVVSNKPVIHHSPFLPPRKKLRLLHHPDFPLDCPFPPPSFLRNPLLPCRPFCHLTDNITAGIQGARHAQIGAPLSNNKLQIELFLVSSSQLDAHAKIHNRTVQSNVDSKKNNSCLLSMGNPCQKREKCESVKTPQFILFGQPILTEQEMSLDNSHDTVSGYRAAELGLDTGHCKVFLESEDFGRTIDLTVLGSYEELFGRLEHMFGIEKSKMLSHVFYCDATGSIKQAGDEPFSEFAKTAKRLTILKKPCSNIAQRKLLTGLPTASRGLDSSNQAGPLTIFA